MLSAREEEERISSPMETVIWSWGRGVRGGGSWLGGLDKKRKGTDIFQHLDFCADALEVLVVLVFELGEDGVTVLASAFPVSVFGSSHTASQSSFPRSVNHDVISPAPLL